MLFTAAMDFFRNLNNQNFWKKRRGAETECTERIMSIQHTDDKYIKKLSLEYERNLLSKSACISVILHLSVALLSFITSLNYYRHNAYKPVARPVIVDFVRIDTKSYTPVLGQQAVKTNTKDNQQDKTGNIMRSAAPTVQELYKEQPVQRATEKKVAEKQSANDKAQTTSKQKELVVSSNAGAAKKKAIPHKIAPKKNVVQKVKNTDKSAVKKQQTNTVAVAAKKTGATKAKVDLAKKGNVANSMSEFFVKSPSNVHVNAAFADNYGLELTGTEIDVLNVHMKRFWNMPSGHEKAYNIVVEVELFINRDRCVEKAVIVDQGRFNADPEFRLAAECALRAVLDSECSPLPLQADRYDVWRHMIFVFDPREMCR
ncbi:MAG: hypothetical protein LBD36_02955 [Holosporales bacterium]|jgi:hypothetical protein|nr:hypothetical protein [Holosporales bacterium]